MKGQPKLKVEKSFLDYLEACKEVERIPKKVKLKKVTGIEAVCMYCGEGSSRRKRITLYKIKKEGYVCERHLRYYKKDLGKHKNFADLEVKNLKLKCVCGFKLMMKDRILVSKSGKITPAIIKFCSKCGKEMILAKSQAKIFRRQLRELGEIY